MPGFLWLADLDHPQVIWSFHIFNRYLDMAQTVAGVKWHLQWPWWRRVKEIAIYDCAHLCLPHACSKL